MKYPIGIHDFGELRRGGSVYVDKTPQMWKMISEGKYYFLSRPRRFGKSLMVSTLEAFFSDQRELFKDLFADTVEWDWLQYPILHLDLNVGKYTTPEALDNILNTHLSLWEKTYGREDYEKTIETRFMGIVRRAYEQTGRQVVILVDEYDTPTFLIYQLQKTNYPLEMMTREELFEDTLNSINVMDENPQPQLYQSGYLTIRGYDGTFKTYRLGFPNREVEEGFVKFLVPFYSPNKAEKPQMYIANFVRDVQSGNAEGFMQRVERFFDGGDYQVVDKAELYFQNTLWALFKLLGLYVDVERHTTDGRMDILVETKDYVYILELKIDQSADVALQQIEEKQYAKPFEGDGRTIYKIGVSFSGQTRRIAEWKIYNCRT